MPDALLALIFAAAAAVSLAASWVLVSRLERWGDSLGMSEALLGMVAALAADAPEITAAATALATHNSRIGAGVVIGSNVFNLATLLGLSAVIARRIALHRRVLMLEGAIALWIALVCLLVVAGTLAAVTGLGLTLLVLAPYVAVLAAPPGRLPLPAGIAAWLAEAIVEEEIELEQARLPSPPGSRDGTVTILATAIVVAASMAMERTASTLGTRHAVPGIVVGGLLLAAVTSLPNAVAAGYLARRGRGAATLSTAMNSNALNVAGGLLVPGTIVGLGSTTGSGTFVAATYLGLTAVALVCAFVARGLGTLHGTFIIMIYVGFVIALLLTS